MKRSRVLTVDVGNSQTALGLFEGERLRWHRRFETQKILSQLKKIGTLQPDGVVVSSVVPEINRPLRSLLKKKFKQDPLFVSSRTPLPIKILTKIPAQLGADRIANAVGAGLKPAPTPIIVIDFGTATTFDVISAQGEFLGGLIVAGLGISNQALHEKTAKLPLVKIRSPRRVIGITTAQSIQSGTYYGYVAMVDGLIKKIQKELGQKPYVIATGGWCRFLAKGCHSIDVVDPILTLKGLRLIYNHFGRFGSPHR